MKITIETKDNTISIEVPNFNGCTSETWEKQGYDIFKKCVEYIFKNSLNGRKPSNWKPQEYLRKSK